jgi:hypothetical protein
VRGVEVWAAVGACKAEFEEHGTAERLGGRAVWNTITVGFGSCVDSCRDECVSVVTGTCDWEVTGRPGCGVFLQRRNDDIAGAALRTAGC